MIGVRELEVVSERPVRLQGNLLAVDPDRGVGMRAAVEDDLRVHVHEKPAFALFGERLRAPACARGGAPTGTQRAEQAALRRPPTALRGKEDLGESPLFGEEAGAFGVQLFLKLLADELIDLAG